MSSRPVIVLLFLLSLCGLAGAQVRPTAMAAEGTSDEFWIAESGPAADGSMLTSIRQRTDPRSGKWDEIARLQDSVTAMAGLGSRLAIVTGADWRLVWDGGGMLGPPLPGGRRILRIAAEGDALWAVGSAPQNGPDKAPRQASAAATVGELFRWDAARGWASRGALPPEAGAAGSLAIVDGAAWVAYLTGKSLCIDHATATGWTRVAALPMTPAFKLLAARPAPAGRAAPQLAWRDAAGVWTIYDLAQKPPLAVRTVPTTGPSDVTIASSSLRVLSLTSDGVSQLAIDNFGRGTQSGPDLIGQVTPAVDRRNEWPNFFLMGLVTAALVVGMRSRTLPESDVLAAAHVRVAPLGRRLAAGGIDALPYLMAWLYVSRRFGTSPITVEDAPLGLYLPIFAGLAIYVVHVAISEILFGRSLGKFIFGLRVVAVDGTPATTGRIVLRNLMRVLDVALGLPFLFIILSPTGQRFGDMAARTLVVADVRGEKPA